MHLLCMREECFCAYVSTNNKWKKPKRIPLATARKNYMTVTRLAFCAVDVCVEYTVCFQNNDIKVAIIIRRDVDNHGKPCQNLGEIIFYNPRKKIQYTWQM